MQRPRVQIATAVIGYWIYTMGGYFNANNVNWRDKYDTQHNRWLLSPPMNEPKYWASACTFCDRYVYTFGGKLFRPEFGATFLSTVEKLDVLEEESGWRKLLLGGPASTIGTILGCGIAAINDSSFMLFGGLFKEKQPTCSYRYDVLTNSMYGDLPNPISCRYYEGCTLAIAGTFIYALNSDTECIRYSLARKTWEAFTVDKDNTIKTALDSTLVE